MNIIPAAWLAACLMAAGPGSPPRWELGLQGAGRPIGSLSGWLLLDADALACSSCISRDLGSIRGWPEGFLRANLWIIVLYDPPQPGVDEALRRRLIGRRADAVFRAFHLDLPVVIDNTEKWRGFSDGGPALVVFDSVTRSARTFALPFSPADREAIRIILHLGDQPHGVPNRL